MFQGESFTEVRTELQEAFKDFTVRGVAIQNSPHFYYYCAIGSVLSTTSDGVRAAVRDLEEDMTRLLADRLKTTAKEAEQAGAKYFADRRVTFDKFMGDSDPYLLAKRGVPRRQYPKYPAQDGTYGNVLSSALATEEQKGGFSSALTYLWGGDPTTFRYNLRTRRHFKDYGASANHGEYTHRVQWYIVSRAVFQSAKVCADVYAGISDWSGKKDGREFHLWDFLFDRADNTSFKQAHRHDFRNPINLHEWLRVTQKDALPFLSAFLTYRRAKREKPFDNQFTGLTSTHMAAALKLYNRCWAMLTPAQKQTCVDLVGKVGIQTKARFGDTWWQINFPRLLDVLHLND